MGTAETQQPTGIAAHIIKRPRLTKILDETEARIILLCAPAGYGKTTLAREWVATRSEPVYWYSGGPAMADVAALAVDLAELLVAGDVQALERLRFLASRGEPARRMAKSLASAIPERNFALVLDDYQFAASGDSADTLVRELVGQVPAHFLVTSRVRPRWLSGRRVIYGELLALTQQDLAFTRDEAHQVLPDTDSLFERSQGWPALIGLAAITGDTEGIGDHIGSSELYDFLADELFDGVSETLRDSVMTLAAGADRSPEVAQCVLGARWKDIIEGAADRGFVTRSADGWIAMHPLLRVFLMRKLRELSPTTREQTIRSVVMALRAAADWDGCLAIFEHFPELLGAGDVLNDALPELLAAGRSATVERWVHVGRAMAATDAIFLLAEAELAMRRGDYGSAVTLGEEAAIRLEADMSARAFVVAARAAHQLDDFEVALRNARAAENVAQALDLQTEAVWISFASLYEHDHDELKRTFHRLQAVPDSRADHSLRVACAEAFVEFGPGGTLHNALRAAERAVVIARTIRDPLARTNALNLHTHLLRITGQYEESLAAIPEVEAEAEAASLDFVLHHALIARVGALVGLRSLSDARRALRKLLQLKSLSDHVDRNAMMMEARLRIASGDLRGARVALARRDDGPIVLMGELFALRALVAASLNDREQARHALKAARSAIAYVEPAALARLVEGVLAHQEDQKTAAASSAVAYALEVGARDAVVTCCRAYPPIGAAAVSDGLESELRQLFVGSNDHDLARATGVTVPREYRRSVGLSKRELEVYELLVAGRTNAEIARTLFIGQSTAKVHVRHIYEKLGVHSRAEAAAADVEVVVRDEE